MKHFIFVVLLMLAIAANAQMNVEEISYVPSRSGFYNNLIVKGDATINKILTDPFDIRSYGSLLRLNFPTSTIQINNLTVSTGTAYILNGTDPSKVYTITLNGGNLSVSRFPNQSGDTILQIPKFWIRAPETETVITSTVRTETYVDQQHNVRDVYILGMRTIFNGISYWQPVKVTKSDGTENKYTILAYSNAGYNKQKQEVCLRKNIQACIDRNYADYDDGTSCWDTYVWRRQTTCWGFYMNSWLSLDDKVTGNCPVYTSSSIQYSSENNANKYECYNTRNDNEITGYYNGQYCHCKDTVGPQITNIPGYSTNYNPGQPTYGTCWPHYYVHNGPNPCGIIPEDDLTDPYTSTNW